jgi:hypothetical protein
MGMNFVIRGLSPPKREKGCPIPPFKDSYIYMKCLVVWSQEL